MLFICHPTCTTCKSAAAFLQGKNLEYTTRDIRQQNPSIDELRTWHAHSGLPLKRFFNTSGILYREMGLSKKLPDMTMEEQLALLSSDGMLVRRPILVDQEMVLVGFDQSLWEQALQSDAATRH